MRVLISNCCSFSLSREAVIRARELDASWSFPDHIAIKGEDGCWLNDDKYERTEQYYLDSKVPRHDPVLLQLFDEMGQDLNGDRDYEINCIEIPDDVSYFVGSYIAEWIAEAHRTWTTNAGECPGGGPIFTKDSKFYDFTP